MNDIEKEIRAQIKALIENEIKNQLKELLPKQDKLNEIFINECTNMIVCINQFNYV